MSATWLPPMPIDSMAVDSIPLDSISVKCTSGAQSVGPDETLHSRQSHRGLQDVRHRGTPPTFDSLPNDVLHNIVAFLEPVMTLGTLWKLSTRWAGICRVVPLKGELMLSRAQTSGLLSILPDWTDDQAGLSDGSPHRAVMEASAFSAQAGSFACDLRRRSFSLSGARLTLPTSSGTRRKRLLSLLLWLLPATLQSLVIGVAEDDGLSLGEKQSDCSVSIPHARSCLRRGSFSSLESPGCTAWPRLSGRDAGLAEPPYQCQACAPRRRSESNERAAESELGGLRTRRLTANSARKGPSFAFQTNWVANASPCSACDDTCIDSLWLEEEDWLKIFVRFTAIRKLHVVVARRAGLSARPIMRLRLPSTFGTPRRRSGSAGGSEQGGHEPCSPESRCWESLALSSPVYPERMSLSSTQRDSEPFQEVCPTLGRLEELEISEITTDAYSASAGCSLPSLRVLRLGFIEVNIGRHDIRPFFHEPGPLRTVACHAWSHPLEDLRLFVDGDDDEQLRLALVLNRALDPALEARAGGHREPEETPVVGATSCAGGGYPQTHAPLFPHLKCLQVPRFGLISPSLPSAAPFLEVLLGFESWEFYSAVIKRVVSRPPIDWDVTGEESPRFCPQESQTDDDFHVFQHNGQPEIVRVSRGGLSSIERAVLELATPQSIVPVLSQNSFGSPRQDRNESDEIPVMPARHQRIDRIASGHSVGSSWTPAATIEEDDTDFFPDSDSRLPDDEGATRPEDPCCHQFFATPMTPQDASSQGQSRMHHSISSRAFLASIDAGEIHRENSSSDRSFWEGERFGGSPQQPTGLALPPRRSTASAAVRPTFSGERLSPESQARRASHRRCVGPFLRPQELLESVRGQGASATDASLPAARCSLSQPQRQRLASTASTVTCVVIVSKRPSGRHLGAVVKRWIAPQRPSWQEDMRADHPSLGDGPRERENGQRPCSPLESSPVGSPPDPPGYVVITIRQTPSVIRLQQLLHRLPKIRNIGFHEKIEPHLLQFFIPLKKS